MTLTTLPAHLMPMVEKALKDAIGREENYDYSELEEDRRAVELGILAFLNACLDGGVAKLDPAWEHPALCTSIILNIGEG